MSTPIRQRLKRRLSAALAVVSSAAVLLVGLPSVASAAPGDYAKITGGKRCDQMHLKKTIPRTPNNSGAPTGQQHWTRSGPDEEYYYNNAFKGFENVPAPTAAELGQVTGSRADIDKWDKAYAASKNPEDMRKAIYARYQRHRNESNNPKPFGSWKVNLISAQVSKQKGACSRSRRFRTSTWSAPTGCARSRSRSSTRTARRSPPGGTTPTTSAPVSWGVQVRREAESRPSSTPTGSSCGTRTRSTTSPGTA